VTLAKRAFPLAITAALLSTAVRAGLALRDCGFQTGDDVEIAEEAFRRAVGLLHGPWNIRSLLIPDLFVAPFVKFAHILGIRDAFALAEIARLPFVLLAGVNVVLLFFVGRRWFDERTGAIAAVLYAAHWIPLVYGSSLYPRTIAVTCILGAILLAPRNALLAGALAALAITTRYSEAIFFVSLFVILDLRRKTFLAGFVLGVLVFVGAYDWITWGTPFSSLVEFIEFTLRGDASSRVVNQPVWWYVTNLPHWIAITAIPLIVIGARKAPRAFLAFVAIPLVALSLVFHKELRYLQVIVPFAMLFAAHGFVVWPRRKLALALLLLSIPLGLTHIRLAERRSTNAVNAARWIATQHPRAVILPQAWAYGGRIFLGNAPRINDPGTPPEPARLREILPDADCIAMYTSDAIGERERVVREHGFTTRVNFANRGGRAVSVFCRTPRSPIPTPR